MKITSLGTNSLNILNQTNQAKSSNQLAFSGKIDIISEGIENSRVSDQIIDFLSIQIPTLGGGVRGHRDGSQYTLEFADRIDEKVKPIIGIVNENLNELKISNIKLTHTPGGQKF